jgi:hypothetical protein
MPDWTKPVFSSNVNEIGYREEGSEMTVAWSKGRVSVYSGVPEELALQVASAPSVGSILNTEIKPYYSHRYQ